MSCATDRASARRSRFRPTHRATFRACTFVHRTIPPRARVLLDKFGYRDRDGDGWRERPDGQPLLLHIGTTPGPNVNASSGRTVCASLNEPKDASLVDELRLGAVFTCAQSRLCTADVEDAPNFLQ